MLAYHKSKVKKDYEKTMEMCCQTNFITSKNINK